MRYFANAIIRHSIFTFTEHLWHHHGIGPIFCVRSSRYPLFVSGDKSSIFICIKHILFQNGIQFFSTPLATSKMSFNTYVTSIKTDNKTEKKVMRALCDSFSKQTQKTEIRLFRSERRVRALANPWSPHFRSKFGFRRKKNETRNK